MKTLLNIIYRTTVEMFRSFWLVVVGGIVLLLVWNSDISSSTEIGYAIVKWIALPLMAVFLILYTSPFQILGYRYHEKDLFFGTCTIGAISLFPSVNDHLPELRILLIPLGALTVLGWAYATLADSKMQEQRLEGPDSNPTFQNCGNENETSVNAIVYVAKTSSTTFADVVGMAEVKARMGDAVREIVLSRKSKSASRNGILFSGQPGNGKTLMAEAIAGEMKLKLLTVSFGDFASRFVNQTTEQVRKVFEDARRQAPCVLFLDEIDSILGDRATVANSDSEGPKTTNMVLTELVNIRKAGVVVIAATNYLNKLDGAAIREGRFDFKIEIPNPDPEARSGIILGKVRKIPGLAIEQSAVLQASKRWNGFSVARIRAVMDEAITALQKEGRQELSYADLQVALRVVQGRKGALPEGTPVIDDLTMPGAQKAKLTNIAMRLKEIEWFESQGGSVPAGLLFYGPPGTGKTLTARALAKTSGWAFLTTCGADLLAKSDAIDSLVKEASDLRPCIVFIDEADDVCCMREGSSQYVRSITNKLLVAMDGAEGKVSDILWIAATNHPDDIDPAVQRRLVEKLAFDLPDEATMLDYVQKWTDTVKLSCSIDSTVIAGHLVGLPIALAKDVLQHAVNTAITRNLGSTRRDAPTIIEGDIIEARQVVVR